VKDLFAGRTANVQADARRQITRAKNAFKRLYRTQVRAAKQKRAAEVTLITSVRDRGTEYIRQMPVR